MSELKPGFERIYVGGNEVVVNSSTANVEVAAGRATRNQPSIKQSTRKEAAK